MKMEEIFKLQMKDLYADGTTVCLQIEFRSTDQKIKFCAHQKTLYRLKDYLKIEELCAS